MKNILIQDQITRSPKIIYRKLDCIYLVFLRQQQAAAQCQCVSSSVDQSVSVAGPKRATSLSPTLGIYANQYEISYVPADSRSPSRDPRSSIQQPTSTSTSKIQLELQLQPRSLHPHHKASVLPLKLVQFHFFDFTLMPKPRLLFYICSYIMPWPMSLIVSLSAGLAPFLSRFPNFG